MIEVHEQLTVPADSDTVWTILRTPEEAVQCIPGAVLEERHEDGTYSGSVVVQFGPARVRFGARVAFEVDEVARIGRITGRGKDATGGTRARMAFGFAVRPEGDATVVTGEGTVDIRGPLAGLIESGASVVVRRMLSEILARLTERCARPAVPEGGRDDPPPLADGGRLQRLTGWPTARGRAE